MAVITPSVAGEWKDCNLCPALVGVPAGTLATTRRVNGADDAVRVPVAPVALGAAEVSRAEFAVFVARTGYDAGEPWRSQADRNPQLPVTGLDIHAVQAYLRWLSRVSGQRYRLPTEVEWEFAARGGVDTTFWWGNEAADGCGREVLPRSALVGWFDDRDCVAAEQLTVADAHAEQRGQSLAPVRSTAANPYGLHDMLGNAPELALWSVELKNDEDAGYNSVILAVARGDSLLADELAASRGGRLFDGSVFTVVLTAGFRVAREWQP